MRRAAATVAALLLPACTLLDGRPGIEVSPEALGRLNQDFTLEVRAEEGVEVTVLLDGRELQRVRSAGSVPVAIGPLASGEHRLLARTGGTYPVGVERRFVVDREGPALTLVPPDGTYRKDVTVELHASDLAGVGALEVTAVEGVSVEQVNPGLWRISAAGASPETVTQPLALRDGLGNPSTVRVGFTDRRPVRFLPPAGGGPVVLGGGVKTPCDLAWWAYADEVRLRLDRRIVAQVAARPGSDGCVVEWDTRDFADGPHLLEIDVPGVPPPDAMAITLDNVADPIACGPDPRYDGLPVLNTSVVLTSADRYTIAFDALPVAQLGYAEAVTYRDWAGALCVNCWGACAGVPLPATLSVTIPRAGVADPAGNHPPADVSCAFEIPVWAAPLGAGPVALAQGAAARWAQATFVPAWRTRYDQCDRPLTADLYWVGPDGALRDRSGAVLAEGPVAEIGRVNEDDPLQPQAWIAEASGAGEVYLRWRDVQTPYVVDGPLNLEPGSDARRLAFWSDGNLSLAWLETGSGGAKVVHCRGVYASPTCAEVGAPGLPVDGGIDTIGALVAFSSRIDGGAAQVRVLRGDAWSGYEDLGAVNDDAGADAFDPALLDGIYDEVAWIEGGRLFTRKRGNDWLPAVPVATGGAPRWPRLAGGEIEQASWLVWVEPGTGGDAIRAARRPWLGELEPWATVATAVNVGVPGTVAALAVSRQEPLTVTWVDGAGAVHVRVASR